MPHDPFSGEDFRKRNREQREWGYAAGTLVAVDLVGGLTGVATQDQPPGAYHPQRLTLELAAARRPSAPWPARITRSHPAS